MSIGFKLLSKILGNFDLNLLDIAAAAGDALVKFRDWLFETGFIAKAFDAIVGGVTKGVVAIRDWIKAFVKIPKVQATIKRFSDAFSKTFGNIKKIGSDVWGIIKNFIDSFKSMDKISIENVGAALTSFWEQIKTYFSKLDFKSIFGSIGKALKKFKDDVVEYFESAGIKFDDIKQKIIEFVKAVKEKLGDNMGTILAIGVLATFLFLVKKIKDAVTLIAKPFGMVEDFLGNLGSTLKDFGKAAKAIALKNVAMSIAILAASVAVLALLDQKKVWSAVGAITVLAAELIAMSLILGKFKTGDFGKMSLSILGIAGSMLILAIAMKVMGGLDAGTLIKGGIAIATLLGIIAILSKSTKGINMWVDEFGKMMVKLSIALLLMAGVTKIFGSMDTDTLIKGVTTVGIFLGMMVGMMAATKLLDKDIPKFGSMMLGLSTALLLMAGAVAIFGNMKTDTIIKGGLVMSAFLVIILGMMKVTKSIGSEAGKFGLMMLGIGAALLMMSAAIAILGNMDGETITKGGLAVAAMMGIMALMMAATKLLGENSGNAAKVGVMMLAFSGALLIMTASIALLSVIKEEDITKAIGAITKIGLLFGALIILSKFAGAADTCKGTIITMSIAIGVLALSLAGLSFVDPSKLTGATTALSIVIGMFALLVAATGLMKKATGTMWALAGILLIMSGVLIILAQMPIENTLSAAASLSMLILSLSASCLMLSFVPAGGAISGIIALAEIILGIGVIMAAIAALDHFIPGLADFLNNAIPTLTALGEGIGSFLGGIVGGVMAGISAGLPEIGTNLSLFMTNLTPFIEGAKGIGEDTMTGVKNLAETILLLTAANVLDSIASFITGGSTISDFAAQLVPFGTAMAEFSGIVAGNINEEAVTAAANAGKIMAEMASTLPNSGGVVGFFAGENDMATFAAGLVPFGNAITQFSSIVSGKVNEDAVLAAANAGKMMAEMAATIPNTGGVVAFFAGDNNMATFATGLVPFGTAISEFSTVVAGLDESSVTAAANAGKMMAEMANTIPNTGGVVAFFAGDNNMATFGTQLVSFGSAIKSFAAEVTGLDESAVTTAAAAGTMMAEMANTIPNTGGLITIFNGDNSMATFGIQLALFGKAIKGFSNEVTGIDITAVTTATDAGSKLAAMAKNLPESGGIWRAFSADNDMGTFASEIEKFGKGISKFATSVTGIDTAAVDSAVAAGTTISTMASGLTTTGVENLETFAKNISTFGTKLKSFATSITGIDTTTMSAAISEIQKLGNIDLSGLESLATSLGTIGTTSVTKFLESFTDASDNFKKAGEALMKKVVDGVKSVNDTLTKAAKKLTSNALDEIKDYKDDFYDAGDYLVQGFAKGISENTFKAKAAAKAMAKAAIESAEKEAGIASPSKETYKDGKFFVDGFVNAITDYSYKSRRAGSYMAESAKIGLSRAISKVRDMVESGIDAQPTIRPVLDLSAVAAGAGSINSMFNMNPSVGAMSNIRAINSMMNSGQNGMTNDDVVSAIKDLGRKLGDISGDTYNFGSITYGSDSEIAGALQTIVRAARIERRS